MFCFKTNKSYKETINKSKFICLGFNIDDSNKVREILKQLHQNYHDASHICYSYILGNNQEEFYYSDDGEPNKTAGFPIYNNMKKYNLSYCMIVIIRYFGGIKFGVGPLKEAFSNLSEKLICTNKLIKVEMVSLYKINFSYEQIKKYQNLFNNSIIKKEFNEQVSFFVYENKENISSLKQSKAELINKNYLLIG